MFEVCDLSVNSEEDEQQHTVVVHIMSVFTSCYAFVGRNNGNQMWSGWSSLLVQ